MSDPVAQASWIARVLGIAIRHDTPHPNAAGSADPLDLTARLQSAERTLRHLRGVSAPESARLDAQYEQLVAAGRRADIAGALDALEGEITRSTSAARAREATPAPGRGVAYRKLLLRWRDAQAAFHGNLQTLGKTLLARPDIQADPRIADIEQAVANLAKAFPTFSGRLEDALDAGLNAADPTESARLAAESIKAIDAYRQVLAASSPLLDLEEFATTDLGSRLPLHGVLDKALIDLRTQLAA
jgi:hypothetical protein